MLAPSIFVLGVFVFYPLGRAMLARPPELRRRRRALRRARRVAAVRQRVQQLRVPQRAGQHVRSLALLTVPPAWPLGIGLAVLADKHLRGIGVFRTFFSSTVATSVAVASLIWFVLLQPQVGILPDLFCRHLPGAEEPGPAQRRDVGPAGRRREHDLVRASGSRSSSSPPRCRACREDLYESAVRRRRRRAGGGSPT